MPIVTANNVRLHWVKLAVAKWVDFKFLLNKQIHWFHFREVLQMVHMWWMHFDIKQKNIIRKLKVLPTVSFWSAASLQYFRRLFERSTERRPTSIPRPFNQLVSPSDRPLRPTTTPPSFTRWHSIRLALDSHFCLTHRLQRASALQSPPTSSSNLLHPFDLSLSSLHRRRERHESPQTSVTDAPGPVHLLGRCASEFIRKLLEDKNAAGDLELEKKKSPLSFIRWTQLLLLQYVRCKKPGREFNKRRCTLLLFEDLCTCVYVCVTILPRTLMCSGTRLICADGDCYVFMEEWEAMEEEGEGHRRPRVTVNHRKESRVE